MAAAHWLRENSPELKVSVVNVVDLMTLFPARVLPARDKLLDLDPMNPPTETLMMGLLKDQDREGSRGTNYGA